MNNSCLLFQLVTKHALEIRCNQCLFYWRGTFSQIDHMYILFFSLLLRAGLRAYTGPLHTSLFHAILIASSQERIGYLSGASSGQTYSKCLWIFRFFYRPRPCYRFFVCNSPQVPIRDCFWPEYTMYFAKTLLFVKTCIICVQCLILHPYSSVLFTLASYILIFVLLLNLPVASYWLQSSEGAGCFRNSALYVFHGPAIGCNDTSQVAEAIDLFYLLVTKADELVTRVVDVHCLCFSYVPTLLALANLTICLVLLSMSSAQFRYSSFISADQVMPLPVGHTCCIASFRTMSKRNGDSGHPCLTPELVIKGWFSFPFCNTIVSASLYMVPSIRVILDWIPLFLRHVLRIF